MTFFQDSEVPNISEEEPTENESIREMESSRGRGARNEEQGQRGRRNRGRGGNRGRGRLALVPEENSEQNGANHEQTLQVCLIQS